ncbi:MAG TPA: chemotaxis protein CheX [Fimbriimonadaceae bacterium]|nr:chemotaxis protein CheX [Fimbriimonadaceae bacterium]
MRAEFVNPFLNASFSVLNMVLNELPERGPIGVQPNNTTSHQINVVCGVTGRLHGQIILGMGETTANRIASVMAGQPLKVFDAFVASAIAELGNMISGNALMGLSDGGFVCDITPPTIVRGANVEISTLEIAAITIHLETTFGKIAITVGLSEVGEHAGAVRLSKAG